MRTLIATLIASTVSVVAFQAAHAADAIDEIPQAPAAEYSEPVASGNWAGAYAGGTASWQRGDFNRQGDAKANGLGGGVYGGYNMQSGQLVYGGETDLNYSGVDAERNGLKGKQGVNGSIRGRVGYDLNPFLVYGTAGVAVANHELEGNGTNDEKLAAGYTVGAGVETFVTDNITARVEYRYSDYQKRDFDLGTGAISKGFDDHSVKVGMGVKF